MAQIWIWIGVHKLFVSFYTESWSQHRICLDSYSVVMQMASWLAAAAMQLWLFGWNGYWWLYTMAVFGWNGYTAESQIITALSFSNSEATVYSWEQCGCVQKQLWLSLLLFPYGYGSDWLCFTFSNSPTMSWSFLWNEHDGVHSGEKTYSCNE